VALRLLYLALLLQLLLRERMCGMLLRLGLHGRHKRLRLRCLPRLGGRKCLHLSGEVPAATLLLTLALRLLLLLQWLLLAATHLAGS
jgi:hypothetical protein